MVATEEKGGSAILLKRMLLVLTVAVLMAVMLVAMESPALASAKQCQGNGCSFGRLASTCASGEATGCFINTGGKGNDGGHSKVFDPFPPGNRR
jgi:hypothetical protein